MDDKSGNGQLPNFINDPVINRLTAPENKLERPRISYTRAGICVLVFFVVGIATSCVMAMLMQGSVWILFMSTFRYFPFVFTLLFFLSLRFILIWFIHLYQSYAKSETRLRCNFTPSCSEYAIIAIRKYGAFIGVSKAIRRLLRCFPPGGIDYP